jgi:four helix bundle protein
MVKSNVVRDKSYAFAVSIVRFCRKHSDQSIRSMITRLLRFATSVAADIEEATAAQSRSDFLSKMSIASKEARETSFWLRLLRDAEAVPASSVADLSANAMELTRILTAIMKTTREKPDAAVSRNSKFKIQNSKFASREAP